MTWAFVGSATTAGGTNVISYTPTAGNHLILVTLTSAGGGSPNSFITSIGGSGTWTGGFGGIGSSTNIKSTPFNNFIGVFYQSNVQAGISSITVNFQGGTPSACQLWVFEYSGIATTNSFISIVNSLNSTVNPGAGANAATAASLAIANHPSLVFSFFLSENGAINSLTAGTSWSQRYKNTAAQVNAGVLAEDLRLGTNSGGVVATATDSAGNATTENAFTIAFLEASPPTSVLVGINVPTTGGTGTTVGSTNAYSNTSATDVCTQTGTVGSLNMYFASIGVATHIYMALYDDVGPNLLCGGFTTISTGLNKIPISSGPTVTLGVQYHLVFQVDGSNAIPVDDGATFHLTSTANSILPLPAILAHNNGATNAAGRAVIWADTSGGVGNFSLLGSTGVISFAGQNTTLTQTSGGFSLAAAFGTYNFVGQAVTMAVGGVFNLIAYPGNYDIVGGQSTSDYQLEVDPGSFTTVGQIVNFTLNGNNSFGFTAAFGAFTVSGPNTPFVVSQAFTLIGSVASYFIIGGDANFAIAGGSGGTTPPAPGTVLNLEVVTDAFQKIGVIDETQAPSAEQGSNGLRILNDYLLSQARDGMRLGWFKQTDLAAAAPIRSEDLWGVKTLLAKQLAIHYGIPVTNPALMEAFEQAEHWLTKRTLKYFESDFSELSRAQGGPWGTGGWF